MKSNEEKRLVLVSEQILRASRLADELQACDHDVTLMDIIDVLAICNLELTSPIHSVNGLAYQLLNAVPGTVAYSQLGSIMGGDPQSLLAEIREAGQESGK